jgi:type IV fimbrial biogenesis protein FimT
MPKEKGLTLIDLFVAMAISAIMLGLGLPELQQLILRQKVDVSTRQIFRHLQKTRELAVLSGNAMIFCGVNAELKCVSEDITRFVIFFDENKNGQVDEGESVASELLIDFPGKIRTNVPRSYFRYFNNGETRPSGSIFLCPKNGDQKLIRRVSTNFTGRPYIARPAQQGIVLGADRNPINCDGELHPTQ